MMSTAKKKRKPHTEERKRNIGLSRQVKMSEEQLETLKGWWKLGYVTHYFIKKHLNIGDKVYNRLLQQYCEWEQVKFLPSDLLPNEAELIIDLCKKEVPYKNIATLINRGEKQTREIIIKLSKKYDIKLYNLPRYSPTGEHLEKIKKNLIVYTKNNPKFGEENGNWKGGKTKLVDTIRKHDKYKVWRLEIFERDGFKCVLCQSREDIQADHIKPFSIILLENGICSLENAIECKELWNVCNGRTLCKICHHKQPTHGTGALKWKSM